MNYCKELNMYRPINMTIITLIPKITNASHLSQFRPIFCCDVIYKLIVKILTRIM